jgi:uncharacterized protein YkwD
MPRLFLVLLVVAQAFGAGAGGVRASQDKRPADLRALAQRIFEAINSQRLKHKLKPLAWDERLAEQARLHSARMAALDLLTHQDPERGAVANRLKKAGIGWRICAENVYEERGFDDPAEEAVQGWMKSRGHRDNILRPDVERTGVGVAARSNGALFFTQIFIRP